MCGIVGYVGRRDALEVVLNGLRLLEYRGYDSAGVAVIDRDGVLQVAKKAGRIENLEKELERPADQRDERHRAHSVGNSRRPQRL